MTASVRHELIRRPLTRTVHAPHCPWSQPFFVPVRCRCSRSASSSEVRGSRSSRRAVLLTVDSTAVDALIAGSLSRPCRGFEPYVQQDVGGFGRTDLRARQQAVARG